MKDLSRDVAIKLHAQRRVLGQFLGMYRSCFRGKGIEYDEIRKFVPGDDIKDIAWAKLAQVGEAYVKTYIEERDLVVIVALDVSGSMFWGRSQKAQLAQEMAALLLFSGSISRDRVGLALFSEKIEKFIPPRRGVQHVGKLIEAVADIQQSRQKTSLDKSLKELAKTRGPKRALIFLISDFVCSHNRWKEDLINLGHTNDLIMIRVEDSFESFPTPIGWAYMEDAEEGLPSIGCCDTLFSNSMRQKMGDLAREMQQFSSLHTFGYLEAKEGQDPAQLLREFFVRRQSVVRRQ
jgi:uncharacterized protein (DUF58 family)